MKKLFLSMVAVMIATMSYAQSSIMATLRHGDEISTFYGATALKEAHTAAVHGDVITLSSGTFQAVDITKAVTIRGAGMQANVVAKIYPTNIDGDFAINVADNLEQRLTIEGIYCDNTVSVYNTLKNATFIKSRFKTFTSINNEEDGYGYMVNLAFIHCKIASSFINSKNGNSVSFVNSVIMNPVVGNSDYNFEFTNCVVSWANRYPYNSSYYAIYRNCILYSKADTSIYGSGDSQYTFLPNTNLIYNCLGICWNNNLFREFNSMGGSMFYSIKDVSVVFKTWKGVYSDTENFELKDDAKTTYLGDDSMELGIYGGNLPFSPNPANPKITKFNVASKSTADGNLSVDIEVKTAE